MVGMPLIVLVVKVVMTMPLQKAIITMLVLVLVVMLDLIYQCWFYTKKNACHDDFNNSRMTSPSKLSLSPSRRKTRRKHH